MSTGFEKTNRKAFMVLLCAILVLIGFALFTRLEPTTATTGEAETKEAAKATEGCFIEEPDPNRPQSFEGLLDAIKWVESRGDASAVCPDGCCIGAYQLAKIYVDDVNRIRKLKNKYYYEYDYTDRFSKLRSRMMVCIYLQYYSEDKTIESMARIHNGGPDGWRDDPDWFVRNRKLTLKQAQKKIANTKAYWIKVKNRMEMVRDAE